MKKENCWYKSVCQKECSDSCIRYLEMKFLMDSSGIPESQQIPKKLRPTSEEDKEAYLKLRYIKDNIVEFVKTGKNLYINSENAGTAKTSWALKLILRYFDQIWSGNGFQVRGLFIHVPTILQQLKNFDNPLSEEHRENIISCDVVIWDDIATSKLSDYDYNQLLILIDHRLLNQKSNIYTSNAVSKSELDNAIGARLSSRIYNTSNIITFTSKDCRGINWEEFDGTTSNIK